MLELLFELFPFTTSDNDDAELLIEIGVEAIEERLDELFHFLRIVFRQLPFLPPIVLLLCLFSSSSSKTLRRLER